MIVKSSIKIKNIFYMMCYAWDVLPMLKDIKVGSEKMDDNIYNLLSYVFCEGVKKIIKGGFYKSYEEQNDDLIMPKGKINVFESIHNIYSGQKKLNCSFDEFTSNSSFNQIVKYTLRNISLNKTIEKEISREAKKLILYFNDIDICEPNRHNLGKLIFQRNNYRYKLLIHISKMIYENSFVNEESGKLIFQDIDRTQKMDLLYQYFLLNFYKKHLDKTIYKIHSPKIYYDMDLTNIKTFQEYFDIVEKPGDRRTDIVIENTNASIQMILDAKFYKETTTTAYRNDDERRFRVENINQLRCYIRDTDFEGNIVGALLYPQTTEDYSKGTLYPIEERLVIKTINLNDDWSNIENDLIVFINKLESVATI